MNIVTFKRSLYLKFLGSIHWLWTFCGCRNKVQVKLELPTRERVLGRKKCFAVGVFSATQISRDAPFANGFMACSVEVKLISSHRINSTGRVPQREPVVEISFLWAFTHRADFIPEVTLPMFFILRDESISLSSFVSFLKPKRAGQPLQRTKPPHFHLHLCSYSNWEPAKNLYRYL